MNNVFFNGFMEFEQYDIDLNENIFDTILEYRRKEIDSERFYLEFISSEELSKYNFKDSESLEQFRSCCTTFKRCLPRIAGCNLRDDISESDIRYAGIKLSDPNKNIIGQFDIIKNTMIYSPIFPFIYEENDISTFANDIYFTTITFEKMIENQINNSNKFFLHTGYYETLNDIIRYGNYILKEISKEQMIEYSSNPKLGNKVLKKYLKGKN